MSDLIRGTEREYRKLGRLTVEAELDPPPPFDAPAGARLDEVAVEPRRAPGQKLA